MKLYFGLLALLMLTFLSCEQMNDYHFEYIEDGETKYTTKVDSVETFAGDGRVKIMGILNQPFGVEEIKIYYNDYNDSFLVDYIQQYEIDTVSILLDNLEEKSYTFNIYTGDSEGNKSIKVTAFGTVYGELYRVNLLGRALDTDSARESNLYLNWLAADEMERGTDIMYTNTSGSEVIVNLSNDSSSVVLPDFAEGISFRSLYVPEVTALDSFASEWTDMELQVFESNVIFTHPLLGVSEYTFNKVLRTAGTSSYETGFADQEGAREGTRMKLKVGAENNVEVVFMGSEYLLLPNGVNVYDPATETFTLNYMYDHLTGARTISETLVKK